MVSRWILSWINFDALEFRSSCPRKTDFRLVDHPSKISTFVLASWPLPSHFKGSRLRTTANKCVLALFPRTFASLSFAEQIGFESAPAYISLWPTYEFVAIQLEFWSMCNRMRPECPWSIILRASEKGVGCQNDPRTALYMFWYREIIGRLDWVFR